MIDKENVSYFKQYSNNNGMLECMPFGLHLGKPFSDLPDHYLLWLYEVKELKEWRSNLIDAVEKELEIRVKKAKQERKDQGFIEAP